MTNPGNLHEVEDTVHPESRLTEGQGGDDKPGRVFSPGGEHRAAAHEKNEQHQKETELFASDLGKLLARHLHPEDRLFLAAPPAMLGKLRQSLPKTVEECVFTTYPQSLVQETIEVILTKLKDDLSRMHPSED